MPSRHWRVKLVTELYDLYPISSQGPIKSITDYNVTTECRDNSTIVTLSILFSKNVLENAEYVVCRVKRLKDRKIVLTNMVNFITTEPITDAISLTETTSNSETKSTIQSSKFMIETTTSGTGCKQYVHFVALLFCAFLLLTS